ncbi:MAG: hypothetical protein IKB67_04000 [Clostridia bacterium]|nr:hypothetical protein [Clostridia bacterium]
MKSRRNFVVAILLVAIMCIGVGFAALTSVINGTGTITYGPTFAITWDGAESVNGNVTITVDEGTDLEFSVDTSTWAVNDACTITATVKNDLKYAAKDVEVQSLTTTAVDDYYNVTVELKNGATTIDANGTLDVIITITMTAYPQVDETGFNADFTFKVYAKQAIA